MLARAKTGSFMPIPVNILDDAPDAARGAYGPLGDGGRVVAREGVVAPQVRVGLVGAAAYDVGRVTGGAGRG